VANLKITNWEKRHHKTMQGAILSALAWLFHPSSQSGKNSNTTCIKMAIVCLMYHSFTPASPRLRLTQTGRFKLFDCCLDLFHLPRVEIPGLRQPGTMQRNRHPLNTVCLSCKSDRPQIDWDPSAHSAKTGRKPPTDCTCSQFPCFSRPHAVKAPCQ
jgi:hypothetical protein